MKKISFYTALNSELYPLGAIWAQSLLDVMNDKIDKIFIYDLGLIKKHKKYFLGLSDKIQVFDSHEIIRPKDTYDKNWEKAVSKRTEGLIKICKKEIYPIVMMDSDTMIVKDISDEIYEDCNFQLCEKDDQSSRSGCWFVVHNGQGKSFVKTWRRKTPQMEGNRAESLALSELLKNGVDLNYKSNKDLIVAANTYNPNAKVLHFTNTYSDQLQVPYERINEYNYLPSSISLKLAKYIMATP